MNVAGLVIAFALALAAIALLRRSSLAALLADHPNERSLHLLPTPRVGGLGMLVGAIPVAAAFATGDSGWIVAIAAGLAVVSAIDDARSLPVALRLACHFGAATATVIAIAPTESGFSMDSPVYALLAVLAIAWMANLFNFMDGADGLAGGMAGLGFSALAIAAHRAGAPDLAMIAGAVAAASIAFLAFNFPPARVFLGDAGSVPLGFLAGAVGVLGMVRGAWPAWFPMLVFSPFVVDATLTLAQRFGRREPVWRAHRSHYYQRLVLGGWSHRQLALRGWALMFATSASALVGREGSGALQAAILAAWAVAFGALAVGIDRRYPRGQN